MNITPHYVYLSKCCMYTLVMHKYQGPGRPSHEVSYSVSQCLWAPSVPPVCPQWAPSGPPVGPQWVLSGPPVGPQWAPSGSSVGPQWVLSGPPVGPQWAPSTEFLHAVVLAPKILRLRRGFVKFLHLWSTFYVSSH